MWNLDALQSLLRAALKVGGGYLLAKGLADESAVEAITAGVLALVAILWGVARTRSIHQQSTITNQQSPQPSSITNQLPLLCLVAAALLSGCASANTVAFRSEKLATDAAYASLLSWKAYYAVALTNTQGADLVALTNRNSAIYGASRQFAAALTAADALRESCLTNSAPSNRAALNLSLSAARLQSSNLVHLIQSTMVAP